MTLAISQTNNKSVLYFWTESICGYLVYILVQVARVEI